MCAAVEKRFAEDGLLYSLSEFQIHFGDATGQDAWEQAAGIDAALTRVKDVLPGIDEAHACRFLYVHAYGNNFSDAVDRLVAKSLDAEDYPKEKTAVRGKIVHRSALEAAMSLDWVAEVDERWAAELRGDAAPQIVAGGGGSRSENYNLHGLHALLVLFPKVPRADVRTAFMKAGSYSAAAARLDDKGGRKELKSARKEHSMPAPPCEVPDELVREIAFEGPHSAHIQEALEELRGERERKQQAKSGLFTCGCCFDDTVLPEEVVLCDGENSHPFCLPCVKNLALTTFANGLFAQNFLQAARDSSSIAAIAPVSASSGSSSSWVPALLQRQSAAPAGSASCSAKAAALPPASKMDVKLATLCCPDTSGCTGSFFERSLKQALPPKEYRRYTSRSAALHALASGLTDLVPCPACDFIVQMDDSTDGVIRCFSAECGRVSCRQCGELEHPGLSCDGEGKLRTFMEEQMASVTMKRCPNAKCRKAFERDEGCNKMTCPCGTFFCYLCGDIIDKTRPYDHYKDGHLGGSGTPDANSSCTVYGTPAWAKQSRGSVSDQAEAALQEYLDAHPELKGLGGARLQKIRRQVGLPDVSKRKASAGQVAAVPAPARKRHRVAKNQAKWPWQECSIQ